MQDAGPKNRDYPTLKVSVGWTNKARPSHSAWIEALWSLLIFLHALSLQDFQGTSPTLI
jgi:hypothetical protein